MRTAWIKTLLNPRTALAMLAGLMLALSFPTFERSSLAWLAPGGMLLAALGASGRRTFGLGYLAGLVHYLVSLHWLLHIPFPAGAVAGWLALSAYLALYPAAWVWLCATVLLHGNRSDCSQGASDFGGPSSTRPPLGSDNVREQGLVELGPPCFGRGLAALKLLLELSWTQRAAWCLACAATWVALEMVLARLLTGFPWNFLGVSQYQALPLTQIASVTGVHGVSFLVAWCSVALLCTGAAVAGKFRAPTATTNPTPRRLPPIPFGPFVAPSSLVSFRFALASDLALPLLAVLVIAMSGAAQLLRPSAPAPELRVAVVQPGIPQRLIFDPRESTNRFNKIMELSRLALAAKPDLLVWPEASLPSFEESHYRALTNLIASHRVWMVFGADDAEPLPDPNARRRYRYFNSAFLFGPDGQFVSTYRKRRLVIFGEYIPLERWLPFTKYLTPIEGSFTPGAGPVWFRLEQPSARLAPLICFEDVFPPSASEAVDADTDFLLNLTNNGWFGESAAQWQHAANAVFRAIENRRPLVRCTNNGLTCWIDALGRLRDVAFKDRADVYRAGFKLFRIPLRTPGSPVAPTFYQRYGDLFGWICVALSLAAVVRGRQQSRVSQRS